MMNARKFVPQESPVTRSRRATPEETRAALIAAGAELFAADGIDAPSLDAICDHAGFTRGAFYVHFKDREDLLLAIIEKAVADYMRDVLPEAKSPDGFAEAIKSFVDGATQGGSPLGAGNKMRFQQLLHACMRSTSVRRRIEALFNTVVKRIAENYRLAAEHGFVRNDIDPEHAARFIITVGLGVQAGVEVGMNINVFDYVDTMYRVFGPTNTSSR